ncbi:MAG: PTS sugar transporter subunit IIC [Clostridia bacterium]|nr:PTS sugar transporter subunit IIC [Clostridia bacterium]
MNENEYEKTLTAEQTRQAVPEVNYTDELSPRDTETKTAGGGGGFFKRLIAFLRGKGVSLDPKTYFVDAMSAMALGLFASLLIGTIFGTVASYIPEGNVIHDFFSKLSEIGNTKNAGDAIGAILGIAIAASLKAPMLVMLSAGAVGMFGHQMGCEIVFEGVAKSVTAGPLGAFVCVLVAVEVGKLVSKSTKVDIIVTPATTLGVGALLSMLLCPAIAYACYWLGYFINFATEMMPLLMGIVISVVVGIILTLPISSAAICAMIGISGIAGGAAAAGCCAQMVGFAVISFRENKWGGVVAQGLGTSMLQMGNIVKNPLIWVPATLASAITGPISTCIFKLECVGVSAGMGTCGLVGPIGIISAMQSAEDASVLNIALGIILVCFILPAVLSLVFSEIMRRLGWIGEGDLKLDL